MNYSKRKNGGIRYKIFRVEPDLKSGKDKKITMMKFWAKDDAEAYSKLKDYRRIANKEYTYYYGTTGNYIDSDKNGKKRHFDDIEEMMDNYSKEHNTLFHNVGLWLSVKLMGFSEFCFRVKSAWQRMKNGHADSEAWCLFEHILDDLEYNLPKLRCDETRRPVMKFYYLAKKQLNPNFDLKSNVFEFSNDEEKLAIKLWNDMVDELIENVKLYRYYSDFGIIDTSDADAVKFNEKWKTTLPYKPGTYKVFDYDRLDSLKNRCKNKIFEILRKHGECFWD